MSATTTFALEIVALFVAVCWLALWVRGIARRVQKLEDDRRP